MRIEKDAVKSFIYRIKEDINHVFKEVRTLSSQLGELSGLKTADKSNLVAAINEQNTNMAKAICERGYYQAGNIDDLKSPGVYVCVNCTHSPTTSWGTVTVLKGGTGSFVQIYSAVNNKYYIRHYISETTGWLAWKEFANEWTLLGSGTSVDASSIKNTAREYLINVAINLTTGYIGNIQFVIPYNNLGTSQISGYMYNTTYYGTVVLTTTSAKFMIDTSWTRIFAAGNVVDIAPTITVYYR